MILIILVLLLVGCAPALKDYPDRCDVKQADKQGSGYTMGVFPCKLSHWGKELPEVKEGQSFDRPPRQEP